MRSLFQGARPAWEHLQPWPLGSCVTAWALPSFCLTNQTGSCLHGDHWTVGHVLGTDTTFKNYIDCSLFEVVITGLVEGHWANAISDGARLHTGRPPSDNFHQSLLYSSLAQDVMCQDPSHPLLAWHPVCSGTPVWLGLLSTHICPASSHPFPVQSLLPVPIWMVGRKLTQPQDHGSPA